ncbi:MAG TPA: radical SAM protein [Syntrophales bacterium]|nr:radical SAM protein [Syntrophales bacterium]HOL59296.1 radical SAM protein [Syntrophales bacterium]HPO35511.1 radical SAM protein [Syntrophales bacterium]
MILLLHPPVAKPGEPPGGLVQIAGNLKKAGVAFRVWDASLEGLLYLIQSAEVEEARDTWTRRALSHRFRHLSAFRDLALYENLSRYRRVVGDLTRVLQIEGDKYGVRIGLADYRDPLHLPVSTKDLIYVGEHPEITPFYPYFKRRLFEILEEEEPRIFGISLNFLSQAVNAFALAGLIRSLLPQARIVLGGSLVTSWGRIIGGRNPFQGLIDDLVVGPGETALLKMVAGKGHKFAPVLQACFYDFESEYTSFGRELSYVDLDGFPASDYLSPQLVFPLALSQGCYYGGCRFCPERSEGRGYRVLRPGALEGKIEEVVKNYRTGLIHFLDSALSPRLLRDLIKISPRLSWYGFARITEELADYTFCRALRESGCVMLKLGVESGSQAVLDSLGKGTRLPITSQALKALREAGIATYIYLLFGTPEEGYLEAKETMRFVLEHADFISYLNPAIFNLPAGTRTDLKCRPFYPADLSLYEDFEHPRGWHRRKVRLFLSREFKAAKPIRDILLRTPPVFTSNHAPFFHLMKAQAKS